MTATVAWDATVTATSSLAHGGETRGTITLLRREVVVQPDGRALHVPIVSGNALRGRLRRVGEELLRDVLAYEGLLPLAAAHALRGGGALAKVTGEPLSGRRLLQLRRLVPQIGVFGCAASGRIVDGALQVGKLVPHLAETAHLLPPPAPDRLRSAFGATQLESYTRADGTDTHDFPATTTTALPLDDDGQPDLITLSSADEATRLMLYRVETFPAGTTFTGWLRLSRATDLEVAFFTDVLTTFAGHGRLGGRTATGHGQLAVDLRRTTVTGTPTPIDWRADVAEHRDAALTALQALT